MENGEGEEGEGGVGKAPTNSFGIANYAKIWTGHCHCGLESFIHRLEFLVRKGEMLEDGL